MTTKSRPAAVLYCPSPCRNVLATLGPDGLDSRHRGRRVRAPLETPLTIQCEDCGREVAVPTERHSDSDAQREREDTVR